MIESGIIWWLSQHLLITTALAAVVFLICRVARPNPAARHVLWLIVLCRLLVPPVATWPWSISVLSGDTPDMSNRQSTGANGVDSFLDSLPSRIVSNPGIAAILPYVSGGNMDIANTVAGEDSGLVEASRRFQPAWFIVGLWASGSLITAVVLFRRIRRIGQLLKAEPEVDPWLQDEIADWCRRLAVRAPDCVVHHSARSPFLWCLGSVRLVWPLSSLHSENRERNRPILIHELAHLKRRDHWTAWIELLALILWWWNPVLWFARRQLRVSAEMACDAWVVKLLPDQRRAYAQSLVDINRRGPTLQPSFGAVGSNRCSRRTFKRRLEMIMKESFATRFPKWTAFFAILLGVLSLPAFAIKFAGQPEDSIAQSRAGASDGQSLAEPISQFTQRMDEGRSAETAVVVRNAQELDRENPIAVSAEAPSRRASQQKQEQSDLRPEASSNSSAEEYIIAVEDVLRIDVWKEPELSVDEAIVRPDGKISIPPIGDIKASGLTPEYLKELIQEKLRAFVSSPIVTVVVLQFRHPSVSIVGKVAMPGTYPLDSSTTVLELLARAGGCSEFADVKNIAIVRKSGNQSRYLKFNYEDAAKGNNLENNITLKSGDVVIVP